MRTDNKNIFQSSTCLTQDELVRYHSTKMSESEKHVVEKHLTDCELCTEALEGIALLPDMNAINKVRNEVSKKIFVTKYRKEFFSKS